LISLFYRLLSSFHDTQPISETDKLWQLGLTAFLTTLLMEFNRHSSDYEHLSESLRVAIHHFSDTSVQSKRLLMWCIFIGSVSALNVGGEELLRTLLVETCEPGHLYTWTEVRDVLNLFPWVGILHDAPGKTVWNRVQTSREIAQYSDCAVTVSLL
jgi:hypothetical protein